MDAEMRAKNVEFREDQSQRPKKKRRGGRTLHHISGYGFTATSFIALFPSVQNNQRSLSLGISRKRALMVGN